jgi:hypothetical protein
MGDNGGLVARRIGTDRERTAVHEIILTQMP